MASGDIPFPVYLVARVSRYKIKVLALTPQRGIVAPSTADYVLLRTGACASWQEAFDFTNDHGKYRGLDFVHLKNAVQYNLEPRSYARLMAQRGLDWRSTPHDVALPQAPGDQRWRNDDDSGSRSAA